MSAVIAKNIQKDANTLTASGSNLAVLLDGSGGLASTGSGIKINAASVTNAMLAGSISTANLADGSIFVTTTGTHTLSGTLSSPADSLQITTAPDSANDATNKAYVDSLSSGLSWQEPVHVKEFIGSVASIAAINALTPTAGDAYVSLAAGTPSAGTSDAIVIGSLIEFDGTQWKEIVAGSGGFVPDGFRALAATQTALNGTLGLTDATDDGKILEWDGTTNTPTKTTTLNGWALLVTDQDADGDSLYANLGYTYQGTVATGSWIQFTGAGQINAGAGLTKSANTLNVGDGGKGVQVNANDIVVDASEISGNGLAQVAGGGNEHLLTVKPDVSGVATITVDSNGVSVATTAAGNGLTGGGTAALSVQKDTTTNVADGAAVVVASNGISIDGDLINIDTTFSNFTPTVTGTPGTDVADLGAVLKGIDNALAAFGSGDVAGPGSSTDNAVARFDATTGKIIQNSGVIIDDSNNMTVPGNVIVQGQAGSALNDLGTGTGAIATDLDTGNVQKRVLSGNSTLSNPTNPVSGHTYIWKIAQNGTGGYTLAFGSKFKFPTYTAGTGPAIATSANAVTIISAVYDGDDDLYYAEMSTDAALDAGSITGVPILKTELLTVAANTVTLAETPIDGTAVMVQERNGIMAVGKDLDGTTYDYAISGAVLDFDDSSGTTGDIVNTDQVIVSYTYASS